MFDNLLIFSPVEIYIAGITVGLFLILQLYYLITYARPLRVAKNREQMPRSTQSSHKPPVSIIIYAKNESVNLRQHLPKLLTQEYPEYEVIVVNDGSTDDTDDTLKYFETEYKHLYHTYMPADIRYVSRRKLALTIGIKASKHDILLFTEISCQPISEHWISSMVTGYQETGTNIVLGFCRYGNYMGLGQKMIAYDNLLTGLRYLSFALSGATYTGNGRNLSYRKDLFFRHKGFSQTLNLHAGDDDLFVNEASTKDNTSAIFSPDSLTEMNQIEHLSTWKEIKVSRAATGRQYKGSALFLFRLETFSFFLFMASALASIIIGLIGNWGISVFACLLLTTRFITKAIIFHRAAHMLRQTPSTAWLTILEFAQPLFNAYVHLYQIFRSQKDYTTRLDG